MNQTFFLSTSTREKKRYQVAYINEKTNHINIIHFGSTGLNFTMHHDLNKKKNYLLRHKPNENWDDYYKASFWATNLLWNKKTIDESIKDIENRYKIQIITHV